MLEVGLVVRPRAEQYRVRGATHFCIAGWRPVRQAVAHRGEKLREVLHLEVAEELRKGTRDNDAVLERVARARGRLGAIADHPPVAVGRARQIRGIEVQHHVAGVLDAAAGTQVSRVAIDQRGRQQPFLEQVLLAVYVEQHLVEQRRALHDPSLDAAPFLLGQDHRQEIELPRPVGALRIGVDVVSDAVLAHLFVYRVQPLARALGGPGRELLDQGTPVRARRVRRLDELVVAVGGLRIFGEQLAGHRARD